MVEVCKIDEAQRLVFGWASVAVRKDGTALEDFQGDVIDAEELESAVYPFVLDFRKANGEHVGRTVGYLVESFVVTKAKLAAMGLAEDALPLGWWIGLHVPEDEPWQKVAAGTWAMFSIEGTAYREEMV